MSAIEAAAALETSPRFCSKSGSIGLGSMKPNASQRSASSVVGTISTGWYIWWLKSYIQNSSKLHVTTYRGRPWVFSAQ